MEPTRVTIDGRPGRVKRIRLRDDGSRVAHVRLDDGSLLIVPLEQTGLTEGRGRSDEAPGEEADD